MLIGTPLSPNATRVMLLGSGELGKEVTIAFQRLGVEVIAVDRYDNAPAKQVAHRAYTIDMTDDAALQKIVSEENPHFIVPEIEAINTETLANFEQAGMTVIPNVKAVQLTMDREGIRKLAAETLNIPTSPYAFADSEAALTKAIDNGIGYPCFIKPTMSSSGKGQSRITDKSQIAEAWAYAATGGRVDQGVVIAEGQIDFDYEITLLTVRAKNKAGDIETHFCAPIGHQQQNGDYIESWQPQAMQPKALERSQAVAKAVTDALGGLGLFGVELFIKGEDVWFSEVSPRPHDTGMVTMATQRLSEFELHARAILGLPVDVTLREAGASAVIYGQHETRQLAFSGLEEALSGPNVDIRLFGKPASFKRRRMGVAIASGVTVAEARQQAKAAADAVKPVIHVND